MSTSCEKRVIMIIKSILHDNEVVKPETNLRNETNMDSLDYVEVTMALEEEFGMEISDEQTKEWKLVSDVIDFIEANKQYCKRSQCGCQ